MTFVTVRPRGGGGAPASLVHDLFSRWSLGLSARAPPSIGFPRPPVGAVDPAKVICHEPSVSRASVADAKLKDPADASLTIWWHQFYQA
jgi:hypothetical protein